MSATLETARSIARFYYKHLAHPQAELRDHCHKQLNSIILANPKILTAAFISDLFAAVQNDPKAQLRLIALLSSVIKAEPSLTHLFTPDHVSALAETLTHKAPDEITALTIISLLGHLAVNAPKPTADKAYIELRFAMPKLDGQSLMRAAELIGQTARQRGFAAVADACGELPRLGVYHKRPLALWHVNNEQRFTRADQGIFLVFPYYVRDFTGWGCVGQVKDWQSALRYGNFGVTGLRDLEELVSISEVLREPEEFAPHLINLTKQSKAESLIEAELVGINYLSAVLYLGHRIMQEAREQGQSRSFWRNDQALKKYASWLREIFATGFSKRHGVSMSAARKHLDKQVHWDRFVKQVAFFMTPGHAMHTRAGLSPHRFPQEIFGPHVVVRSIGPYAQGKHNATLGYTTKAGRPSIGPSSGPLMIKEIETAILATVLVD